MTNKKKKINPMVNKKINFLWSIRNHKFFL
jgi:hypothetical protein